MTTVPTFATRFKKGLASAGLAGLITLLAIGPISGLVLDGYTISPHWQRPLGIALFVAFLRLLFAVFEPYLQSWRQSEYADEDNKSLMARWAANRPLMISSLLLLLALCLVFPFVASKYWITVLILALIYVLLGLGLNIVVGLAGLLDLGFVGFYAVGAYSYALGAQYLDLGFWGSIPFAMLLASLFGVVLAFPVLRMHGDYLAIVTLGFGEIIRLILNNWQDFTGGPNGVQIPVPTFFGLEFTRRAKYDGTPIHEFLGVDFSSDYRYIFIYLVLFLFVLAAIWLVSRLKTMPLGRAWEALREDEIACRSLGLNHVTVKLSAFAMGAMIAGTAGVFFAAYQGFVNPSSFTFFESALILAIVVLGGMGSIPGVVLAAVFLTVAPEFLREFSHYRILVFGILMVAIMIWRPRGLIGTKRPHITLET